MTENKNISKENRQKFDEFLTDKSDVYADLSVKSLELKTKLEDAKERTKRARSEQRAIEQSLKNIKHEQDNLIEAAYLASEQIMTNQSEVNQAVDASKQQQNGQQYNQNR